ncbi:MAG: hypothetical protein DRI33_04350 [Caldiserica bacterium]|nr:MAG: hypothetical protein DRI33_04350 [Caldisericota bacterium]
MQKVEILTSYSHAGQYHALQSAVTFNRDGLWFYDHITFSRHGTLRNTLVQIISKSPAGMTHKELKILLHIQVQNTLTNLIKAKKLQRRSSPGQTFVYLSNEHSKALEQWQKRQSLDDSAAGITLPSETVVIDILLEIIRGDERVVNESVLGSRLKKRGIAVSQKQLVYVFTYYDIKKN